MKKYFISGFASYAGTHIPFDEIRELEHFPTTEEELNTLQGLIKDKFHNDLVITITFFKEL